MSFYNNNSPNPSISNLCVTKPGRPSGVTPENYIGQKNIQEHNGVRCVLCVEEEALAVPQLLLPRTQVNKQGSTLCIHVYTPKRGAVFYWNTNGSMFTRRADGSAEYYTGPGGWVKKYAVGTYIQPDGMPYVPLVVLGFGVVRSQRERYYEELFQLYHPLAGTADEGLSRRDPLGECAVRHCTARA